MKRRCYVCHAKLQRSHPSYASMCPECGHESLRRRSLRADLRDRVALVTGGRVKIGHTTALRLLEMGAQVIVTTRFPHDAIDRFLAHPNSSDWKHRLRVYGLDLRDLPAVVGFAQELHDTLDRMDLIVHNAAQSVRRPPAFYRHLMERERRGQETEDARRLLGASTAAAPADALLAKTSMLAPGLSPAALTQLPLVPGDEIQDPALFPPGVYDEDGQQVDRREKTSWVQTFEEISVVELLEVHLINVLAPYALTQGLLPLLRRSPAPHRHLVHVTSVEGNFAGFAGANRKTRYHPHTNMTKAALNMLTLSMAHPMHREGILVNAVDPGFATFGGPDPHGHREGQRPPLTYEDCAARVLDPMLRDLLEGSQVWGCLLKDFRPIPW